MKNLNSFVLTITAAAVLISVLSVNVEASKDHKPPKPTSPPVTAPYICGQDVCAGYRCVIGTSIRPACYNANEIQSVKCEGGTFVYIPTFNACYSTQYYYNWGI